MKTQQISGGNVKAIVVSNNAFQKGAFNFSESKGIGLLRYYDQSNLDWVLTRSPSSLVSSSYALNEWSVAYKGLHTDDFEHKYFDFHGYSNHQYTNSLRLFISSLIKFGREGRFIESLSEVEVTNSKENRIVKYREDFEIEEVSGSILENIGYRSGKISLKKICKLLKREYDLKVIKTANLEKEVLGQISFSPLKILLNKEHKSKFQERFTLAHEIGHFLLGHSEYMSKEKVYETSLDLENPDDIGIRDIMRMEWQANLFASCLLLPKHDFVKSFKTVTTQNELFNRGFGMLYLDNQKCNLDAYYSVTSSLMYKYRVSRSVVKIRLKSLGFINEKNNSPRPVRMDVESLLTDVIC